MPKKSTEALTIAAGEQYRNHRRVLTTVALTAFVTTLDNSIVTVAISSIDRELHIGVVALQWIVISYMVTFAGLLFVAGAVIDRFNPRRVLLIGLLGFGIAAFAGGFARTIPTLLAARIVQGAAAAFIVPATLSMVRTGLHPRQRDLGAATFTAALAVALALGPTIGGALAQYLHWSWVFLVNVPLTMFAAVAAAGAGEPVNDHTTTRINFRAAMVGTIAIVGLIAVTMELGENGRVSPVLAGTVMFAAMAFFAMERGSTNPLIPGELLRTREFSLSLTVQLLWGLGVSGVFFFTPLFLQDALGLTPTESGLPLIALAVAVAVGTPFVGWAQHRFGVGPVAGTGLLLVASGLFGVAGTATLRSIPLLVTCLVVIGLGSAFTTPLTSSALDAADEEHAGIASGVLTAAREVSSAIGVAVIGAVVAARENHLLVSGFSELAAFSGGYVAGLLVAGGCEVVAAALSLAGFRRSRVKRTRVARSRR
jgi:EmrB/QacA subfamily drug resistance transporter